MARTDTAKGARTGKAQTAVAERARRGEARKGTGRRSRRETEGTDAWWAVAEEVPHPELDDAEALNKRARRWRRLVKATLVLSPVALIVAFLAVATTYNSGAEEPIAATDPTLESRSTANAVVVEWLASPVSPIPGGTILGWDTGERFDIAGDAQSGVEEMTYDVHTFDVLAAGFVYDVSVPVAVNGDQREVLAAPSIISTTPFTEADTGDTAPDKTRVPVTEEITAAVEAWAVAYTSGDPTALRRAVADSDPARYYVPLLGASFSDVAASEAYVVKERVDEETGETIDPEQVVVQVSMEVTWASQSLVGPDGEELQPARVTYDLLVDKASTATPVVVAWGGSGTGRTLEPYANATPVEVVYDDSQAPTVDPSTEQQGVTAP